MRRRWMLIAATMVAGVALAGPAEAQPTPNVGLDVVGLGDTDVREEPSHHLDDNGFAPDHDGAFWSPKTDPLILDAMAEEGHVWAHEDLDNLLNRAIHGSNYDDHERTMYPGSNYFTAWWGWWSDTGGGGQLQSDEATAGAPTVGDPDGTIDDADDCEDVDWDEFTWRSDHPCPGTIDHAAYPDDQMFAFVHPGTHRLTLNRMTVTGDPATAILDDDADHPQHPDFGYGDSGQLWEIEGNTARLMYDASLLVTTQVATAVNPAEADAGDGEGTLYDPFTPAGDAADHAVDVDLYTSLDPTVGEAYRIAVWDPGDQRDGPVDALHPNGLKGWAKDDGAEARRQSEAAVDDNVSRTLESVEPQRGLVNDLVQDPFFHEPNQPDDDYNGWATHDPATSYGGLDGNYYEPGPDQAYPGYQDGERFWFDAQVKVNAFPWAIPRLSTAWKEVQVTPSVPDPGAPVEDAAGEDSTTQGPGFLYLYGWAGTWYDGDELADADGWVGDAEDDAPYGHGTVQDPNTYQAEESPIIPGGASGPEWRGTCGVDITATLYPTSDSDGDGTNDWGAAGVYVMGSYADTNPYSNVWMDVVGPAADPVLDPLREDPALGGESSFWFPEDDERLTRYRTEGPIDVDAWRCLGSFHDIGYHQAPYHVVLPTGTLDFTFEAVTRAELTDGSRKSQHGDNQDQSLTGATITDVDPYGSILPESLAGSS